MATKFDIVPPGKLKTDAVRSLRTSIVGSEESYCKFWWLLDQNGWKGRTKRR